MKKLVLGALLVAAASSAACSSSSSDLTVTANWSFKHITDGTARSCPVGFDTVEITAQPVDPDTAAANGNVITTTAFLCEDMHGTLVVPDGFYLMSVDFLDSSGRPYTTQPELKYVDTATDSSFDVEILDDGGYFQFTWGLVDATSQAPMSCSAAGLTASNSGVDAISTLVSDHTYFRDDLYTCADHFGVTDGLKEGTYSVAFQAMVAKTGIGPAANLQDKVITRPNGITDLGHITIPID
jgi:hypothetical protein